MKRLTTITSLVFVILFLLNFGNCATLKNNNPSAALIPVDAVAYLEVRNTEVLLSGLDKFLIKTSLSDNFGNMSIREFLDLMIAMGKTNFSLNWFNLSKPAGLAVLPEEGKLEDWDKALITLPLNPEGLDEKFQQFLQTLEAQNIFTKQVNDYLVLYSQPEIGELIPPKAGLDTSLLSRYADGSLVVFLNFAAFKRATGLTLTEMLAHGAKSLDGDSIGDDVFGNFPVELKDSIFALAEELEQVAFSLVLDEKGLRTEEDLVFTLNGKIHNIGKKMKSGGQALEYLKYLPQDSMFSFTSGVSYAVLIDQLEPMYKVLFKMYGLQEAFISDYFSLVKKAVQSIGPGMAVAFDYHINLNAAQQLSQLEPEDINPALLKELLGVDMLMVYDLKNKADFWDFYTEFDINGMIKQMLAGMEELVDEKIPDFGFQLKIQRDQKLDGFVYDKISFEYDFSMLLMQIENPAEREMVSLVMEILLNQFNIYLHYTDGKYFGRMGSGPEQLRDMMANKGLLQGKSLKDSLNQSSLGDVISPESDFIMQVSIAKIYDLIAGLPNLELEPLNLTNSAGIISAVDFSQNRIHSVSVWEIEEIGALINQLVPFILKKSANLLTQL